MVAGTPRRLQSAYVPVVTPAPAGVGWTVMGSPRALVVRRANSAAASMKMLATISAWWKPATSAAGGDVCTASRCVVRAVAMAEKMARPSAPPIHCDALNSAAASPAVCGGTPALAAVVAATNSAPSPTDKISNPGRRPVR